MPLKRLKQRNGRKNYLKKTDKTGYLTENFLTEYENDNLNQNFEEIRLGNTNGVQIELKEASTQTDQFFTSNYAITTIDHFNFSKVRDLISIFIDSIGGYSSKHKRILSIIIYLILRLVKVSFERTRTILNDIELMAIQKCHSWVLTIFDEADPCVVLRDKRGSHKHISFFERFPELEKVAKAFALSKACQNNCSFKVILYDLVD